MTSVAIVGAGPSGIVTARYLKKHNFEPVIFEQSQDIGGQWNSTGEHSGVWPMMRANTSRIMTCFSDLKYKPDVSVYPHNKEIQSYLRHYAENFDLVQHLRLQTKILDIDQDQSGEGWILRFVDSKGSPHTERFAKVVIASGRYNKPAIPNVPGVESFSGSEGFIHTFQYKEPDQYRGKRVLVAGCSISSLEIASDLAMLGASRVITTNHRQRYVIHKICGGVPADQLYFNRFVALAEESMPFDAIAQSLKEMILKTSGSPEQYGAPKPADNVFQAGITQCQNYLPLVAENRISVKPWIKEIDGNKVRFDDGSEEEVDAFILGTGYYLNLPFLNSRIREALDIDQHHIDLHKFTFHPDFPGLAFLGAFELIGPYFPVLELQARWITYAWSGLRKLPSTDEMKAGIEAYRSRRGQPQLFPMHAIAILFSREAGVEPELERWPELSRILLFGPLSAISFRLSGPDSLPHAAKQIVEEARASGIVRALELTAENRAQLQALAAARNDPAFSNYSEQLLRISSQQLS